MKQIAVQTPRWIWIFTVFFTDQPTFYVFFYPLHTQNEKTLEEVRELARRSEWKVLGERLLQRLTFGTAGLRGVMQAGFNAMNDLVVIQSAQGLAKYLLQCYPSAEDRSRGVVLGYDGRYNSKRYGSEPVCVCV